MIKNINEDTEVGGKKVGKIKKKKNG